MSTRYCTPWIYIAEESITLPPADGLALYVKRILKEHPFARCGGAGCLTLTFYCVYSRHKFVLLVSAGKASTQKNQTQDRLDWKYKL